jgi:hypothetical protein
MIDRYDALLGLRDFSLAEKKDFLLERYSKENFHALKSEILQQLKDDQSENAQSLRRQALQDKMVEVRLSAISNTEIIPTTDLTYYEALLKDSSYSVINACLEKLSRQFPENLEKYLEATQNEKGPGMKTRILWLELKAEKGDNESLRELGDLCSSGFEFITRQNAMNALKRLNYLNPIIIRNWLDAVLNPNYKLAGTASQILKEMMIQSQWKNMIQLEVKLLKSSNPNSKEILGKQGLH